MPRFVLLYHDCPASFSRPSHWDLMFESGSALRTWSLGECPAAGVPLTIPAERLADHRLAYLDYEGPVTDNRGQVSQVAAGTYETLNDTESEFEVRLESDQLSGTMRLSQANSAGLWQFEWRPG